MSVGGKKSKILHKNYLAENLKERHDDTQNSKGSKATDNRHHSNTKILPSLCRKTPRSRVLTF